MVRVLVVSRSLNGVLANELNRLQRTGVTGPDTRRHVPLNLQFESPATPPKMRGMVTVPPIAEHGILAAVSLRGAI